MLKLEPKLLFAPKKKELGNTRTNPIEKIYFMFCRIQAFKGHGKWD